MRTTAILIILAGFVLMAAAPSTTLIVKSSAFEKDGMIPAKYSCEGEEVNPPLTVSNIPADAKSLALIVHDPDAPMAGGCTHWVAWNLGTTGVIVENMKGAAQGINCSGKQGYLGMCPPTGAHHYHFNVYALDSKLELERKTDKATLENAMKGHILAQGTLIGLYKKTKQ